MDRKLMSRRDRRFLEIAKEEATPAGFVKYAAVSKGPWFNGFAIVLIGIVAPFYLLYRFSVRAFQALFRS